MCVPFVCLSCLKWPLERTINHSESSMNNYQSISFRQSNMAMENRPFINPPLLGDVPLPCLIARGYKQFSTIIVYYQPLLTIANHHQHSSTIIKHCSSIININPLLHLVQRNIKSHFKPLELELTIIFC